MKSLKNIQCIVLMSFSFIIGCAQSNVPISPERKVMRNTYYSNTHPEITISVNEPLKQIGHFDYTRPVAYSESPTLEHNNIYFFSDRTNDQEVDRGVVIISKHIKDGKWNLICKPAGKSYENEDIKRGGKMFCRIVGLSYDIIPRIEGFNMAIMEGSKFADAYLYESLITKCPIDIVVYKINLLLKGNPVNISNHPKERGTYIFKIVYFEKLENPSYEWLKHDITELTNAQRSRYDDFVKNAKNSYIIQN